MTTNNTRFITKNGLDANSNSITNLGTSGSSLVLSGAYDTTLTLTGTTNVTLPTTGTLASLTTAQTVTGTWNFSTTVGVGTSSPRTALDIVGLTSLVGVFEGATVSATAATGTINIDYKTQAVYVYTTNASANWTFNIRGDSTTTLNSIMAINQVMTFVFEVPQGTTAYYCTAVTIDGSAPASIKWVGGAPTSGNASGSDIYSISVLKTAASTYSVRASVTQFKT